MVAKARAADPETPEWRSRYSRLLPSSTLALRIKRWPANATSRRREPDGKENADADALRPSRGACRLCPVRSAPDLRCAPPPHALNCAGRAGEAYCWI